MINEIQEFLRIPVTGELDDFTNAAFKNFQLNHSLGQELTEIEEKIKELKMGLLDTDLSTREIINKKYLNPNEYLKTTERKRSIFLHHTAGWNNPYQVVSAWENDTRGPIGTAYVIGGINPVTNDEQYNGDIVECFDPLHSYAWHLGIGNNEVHRNSIGIELCNFGWVTPDKKWGFRTYPMPSKPLGIQIPPTHVIKLSKPFRGYEWWIKYSNEQVKSLEFLIKKLGRETGIDITLGLQRRIKNFKDVWKAFDYDPSIVKSADGLFTHTNVSGPTKWGNYEKWDLFPQDEIIDMIKSL